MDQKEYAFLLVVALATIAIGVFTTSKPLSTFFVESTRQAATTTAAMACRHFPDGVGSKSHSTLSRGSAGSGPSNMGSTVSVSSP